MYGGIQAYKGYINYPVFYDFEYDSVRYAESRGVTINKDNATMFAYSFLQEIENGGYIPGLYTNIDFSNNYFTIDLQRSYDVWIAQYSSRNLYSEYYTIWQYTNEGRVDGINGNVDLNYAYKDYENNDDTNDDINDIEKETLVKKLQQALNSSYDSNLVVDGIYSPETKAQVQQHNLSIRQVNTKLEHTAWLQEVLKEEGYDLEVDGYYGRITESQVEAYQRNNNLNVDGIADINTHNSII